ncbi:MAG: ComEA family DNA-binding protein [Candidatus Latescibacteria bacterium]|nr:ComEA family DNA-binding protein [Candidatus Latescibacterota bacterium]
MFNRQEQLVLLVLGVSLLAGSGAALVDHYQPASLGEFQVLPGAAPAPAPPASQPPPTPGPVRLNSATEAQLIDLPGIGPKTAARIVQYRQEHGAYQTIADLGRVPGIGPRTLEQLRPLVVVD